MTENYKDTLNLPQTGFKMKASLAQREPQWLKACEKSKLYQRIQAHTVDRPAFILHDGPPYANGSIHIGHAVNKILKDIIVKSKWLSGHRSAYVPGWDCHGLPIEIQVEKKHGKVGQKIDAKTFRQKCREYANRQIDLQRTDFKRLGVLGDWERPYKTNDFSYEADMVRALARIVENGHVLKGVKPVNWCFDCESALAEAEIEYMEKKSLAIDVRFDAVDRAALLAAFGVNDDASVVVSVPIWTTTPWTLPANRAVSLNADLEYALVSGLDGQWLVIASELVDAVMARCGATSVQVLGRAPGSALEQMRLKHPFYDLEVPVVLGDHVNTEAGTGAVHTAPGHGAEDFEVGQKYGLEVYNPVMSNGVYAADTPLWGGQFVWRANAAIVEHLKDSGHLLHVEEIEHSYPHCWRHKSPTAFRTTPQWFISMDRRGLRDAALAQIKQVRWVPEWGEERIYKMIENRPEWCISRQRTWGVPIPFFVHRESEELHPRTAELMAQVAERMASKGIDAWFDLDAAELLGDEAVDYEKTTDVLDVWFDSGVSHFCVLKAREELTEPADLYLEGSDQHRGWFHSSLLTGVAINQHAPYRQVLTHGFVVDQNGRKMSKSLGNVIAPSDVVNTLGADILRLWVASADYRGEMSISDEILKRAADGYRRIRNTARFMLGNLNDLRAADFLPLSDCALMDQWIVRKAAALQEEIQAHYSDYQLHMVYQKVHHFCSQTLGAFYLDVLKDRLYTARADSQARRSAQTAMWHVLNALIPWISPILTFTADEILAAMPEHSDAHRAGDVLFLQWHDLPVSRLSGVWADDSSWDDLFEIRQAVLKSIESLRQKGELGASLEAQVALFLPEEWLTLCRGIGDELRFVLITSGVTVHTYAERPQHATEYALARGTLAVAVHKADGEKCQRCWHISESVSADAAHPGICSRCVVNVAGEGESRGFA